MTSENWFGCNSAGYLQLPDELNETAPERYVEQDDPDHGDESKDDDESGHDDRSGDNDERREEGGDSNGSSNTILNGYLAVMSLVTCVLKKLYF